MSTKSTLSKTEQAVLDAANDPILKKMLEQERIESEEVDISLLFRLLSYLKSHRGLASLCFGLSLIEALLMTMPGPIQQSLAILTSFVTAALTPRKQFFPTVQLPETTTWEAIKQLSPILLWWPM